MLANSECRRATVTRTGVGSFGAMVVNFNISDKLEVTWTSVVRLLLLLGLGLGLVLVRARVRVLVLCLVMVVVLALALAL